MVLIKGRCCKWFFEKKLRINVYGYPESCKYDCNIKEITKIISENVDGHIKLEK